LLGVGLSFVAANVAFLIASFLADVVLAFHPRLVTDGMPNELLSLGELAALGTILVQFLLIEITNWRAKRKLPLGWVVSCVSAWFFVFFFYGFFVGDMQLKPALAGTALIEWLLSPMAIVVVLAGASALSWVLAWRWYARRPAPPNDEIF